MTRVYKYGTVPSRIAPVIGEAAAEEQLRLANRLWNTLVAIDRARVERYKLIMFDEGQERIDGLKQRIAAIRDEFKSRRAVARKRKIDTSDLKESMDRARQELGNLIEQRKATSDARHEAKQEELKALTERTKHRIKRARQAAASMGLFWGTYNDIVQRADVGRKAGELQFRRFTGDGTLTAQIMGGALPKQCFDGEHTFFQTERVPGQRWTRARMRIGSDERNPIWLDLPVIFHRPIPPTSMIKSVSMTSRAGKWFLNVTVTESDPQPVLGKPHAGLDIGYRLRPEGIRVAYWTDDAGERGELIVPTVDIERLKKVDSLRSICDRMRDEILPYFSVWLSRMALSDEWRRETQAIAQWRSSDRIARLIRWWADNRLPGDEGMYAAAREWRKQYLHLANWWRNQETGTRARIRERYRIFACHFAKRYSAVHIEDFDLREVQKNPAPESEESKGYADRQRQMVSPSEFRGALINACKREGVAIHKQPSAYTTRSCNVCGKIEEWDQAGELVHTCACGETWDQDYNAAINLLKMGRASGGALRTENPQVRQRKWDRVRGCSQSKMQVDSGEPALGLGT
jgi:Putative transposase DNA-binding domain